MLQSIREGRWTRGLLLETSAPHEMEAGVSSSGVSLLVDESVDRLLLASSSPSSTFGGTESTLSEAHTMLMAHRNSWERCRGRHGVEQVLINYMQGKHGKIPSSGFEGFRT